MQSQLVNSCTYSALPYIDNYLCFFAFESSRRTTFQFKFLHFLFRPLHIGGIGGSKNLFIVTRHDMGEGDEKGVFALRTY